LSQNELGELIEKILSSGVDTIEKLAPHTRALIDLFISQGLYKLGEDKGVNPLFGPISYALATTPEPSENTIELGFMNFGSLKIPATPRFVGLMGLSAFGLIVSLGEGLGGAGSPDIGENVDYNRIVEKSNDIISANTKKEVLNPKDKPPHEEVYRTDWPNVYPALTVMINEVIVSEKIGTGLDKTEKYVKKQIEKTRKISAVERDTLYNLDYTRMRRCIGVSCAYIVNEEVNWLRKRYNYPKAATFPLTPCASYNPELDRFGIYG